MMAEDTIIGKSRRNIFKYRTDGGVEVSDLLPGGAKVLELVRTFGQNYLARTILADGSYAVFHSPNNAMSWTKNQAVFASESEILDITPIGYGKVLMSVADGSAHISDSCGLNWTQKCDNGPLTKSVAFTHAINIDTDVKYDSLYAHTGDEIHLSEDDATTWNKVADLTEFPGWFKGCDISIKGSVNAIFATCGSQLLIKPWDKPNLAPLNTIYISDSPDISQKHPQFRQVRHVEVGADPSNWKQSTWMCSVHLRDDDIIRTYSSPTNDGVFRPVCDHAWSEDHKIFVSSLGISGQPGRNRQMIVSGQRTIDGGLHRQNVISTDASLFRDQRTYYRRG